MKTFLRAITAAMICGLAPVHAFAADMTAPVKTLIGFVEGNWKEGAGEFQDYFSEDKLKTLYSADFADAYREASKHPAFDLPEGQTTGSPFDYDVITNGQDGCPLTDVHVEDDGDGQVTARFRNMTCMEGSEDADKETTVIFHVVEEKGRALIDDIFRVENGNSGPGLKEQMREIAKGE